jgi:hypothetical protein
VKKISTSEEEGEYDRERGCIAGSGDAGIGNLVFFLLFLPILYVTLVLRDAYQTTTGIHPDFRA